MIPERNLFKKYILELYSSKKGCIRYSSTQSNEWYKEKLCKFSQRIQFQEGISNTGFYQRQEVKLIIFKTLVHD